MVCGAGRRLNFNAVQFGGDSAEEVAVLGIIWRTQIFFGAFREALSRGDWTGRSRTGVASHFALLGLTPKGVCHACWQYAGEPAREEARGLFCA